MRMKKKTTFASVCAVIGCVLVVCALGLLIWWLLSGHIAGERADRAVTAIRDILPEPVAAMPEERLDNTMAVLSVDGADYVGLLEFPAQGAVLPVRSDWNRQLPAPCRYRGSIYDGSLAIGATTRSGQFDFYREISTAQVLYFTDMTGNRFAFEVTDILYRQQLSDAVLQPDNADLTLFIKNLRGFEYIVIHCRVRS